MEFVDTVIFALTGLFSVIISYWSLRGAWERRNVNRGVAVSMSIIGGYLGWVATIYALVVLGILSPMNYSPFVRPLFNMLLIGIYFLLLGLERLERKISEKAKPKRKPKP